MTAGQRIAACLLLAAVVASSQQAWETGLADPDERQRVRAVRALAASADGYRYTNRLAPLLDDGSENVRGAVVAGLIKMRTVDAQQLLVAATADISPRVQALAVDGLVDFYVPNYVKTGWLASISTFGSSLKGRFSKPSPLTVSEYIEVNPQTVRAIGSVVRHGRSEQARANAARAVGVLLGRDAVDDLLFGVRSRNSTVILESVLAIKKLRTMSAGPEIVFLLVDPDPAIREAVVQTVGQLRTWEAVPGLVEIIQGDDKPRTRTQALIALAKIPDNGQRELFLRYLVDEDRGLRAAAAEGVGRIGNADDVRLVDHHFAMEKSKSAKLSLAFAAVCLGNFVRLNELVEGLNSKVHRLEARPFLVELARDEEVLRRLYVPLSTGTVSQRRHLAYVLSQSGTEESLPHLENLTNDSNGAVASAAIEALRVLRARL